MILRLTSPATAPYNHVRLRRKDKRKMFKNSKIYLIAIPTCLALLSTILFFKGNDQANALIVNDSKNMPSVVAGSDTRKTNPSASAEDVIAADQKKFNKSRSERLQKALVQSKDWRS